MQRPWFDDDSPPAANVLRVALFAGMAEAAGTRFAEIRWAGGPVADLRTALGAAYPAIGPLLARSAVAIGGRYATEDAPVPPAADVAIIPPVSGG
jgi:molybdopterin converting factor small subunit